MTRASLFWVAVMLLCALAGSWLCKTTALAMAAHTTPLDHPGFMLGLALPVPIVQIAPGWNSILALWACFTLLGYCGWRFARAVGAAGVHVGWVYLAYCVLGCTLTFFSVTHSLDVYYYTLFARLFGVYHVNPYVIPAPIQLADPIVNLNLVPLHNPPFPDPYGPGFTLFAGLVGYLERGAALGFALLTWRLIGVGATLVSALGIVYALRRSPQPPDAGASSRGAATFLFHPLTLYESAVGAHNDLLMIAPAIWAWALADSLPLVAGLLLGVAIAVKYFAVLLLPFTAIRVWRRDKVSALLFTVLALGVPLLCFQPFAFGSAGAGTLQTVAYNISMSLEWLLSLPLWAAHAPAMYLKLLQLVIVGAFAVVALIAIVRYAVSPSKSALYRSITALLLAMPALHPWYAMWIVPIGAQSGRWAVYAWWFAALSLLLYAHEAVLPTPTNHTIFILLALVVFITPVVIVRRASAHEKVASA